MSDENDVAAALGRLHEVAMLAGIRSEVDTDNGHLEAAFDLGEGRLRRVWARLFQAGDSEHIGVEFYSPVLMLPTDSTPPPDMLLDLLRRNQQSFYARYGIANMDGNETVVASADHPLATLDAQELRTLMLAVAHAAEGLAAAVEAAH